MLKNMINIYKIIIIYKTFIYKDLPHSNECGFFMSKNRRNMGLFRRSRDAPNKRNFQDFVKGADIDGYYGSGSGIAVDELKAMQTSAVYACVRVIAETVASLPLFLYKKEKESKIKAYQHPLYEVLHDMPNCENTSFCFREAMMASLLLYGNAYARIIRDKNGHVIELWYLKPNLMTVDRDKGTKKLKYTYTDDNDFKTYEFKSEQIFHIPGLSFNGIKGISPIDQAREAIGLAIATEEFSAKFFANGARPGGVLEHPGIVKNPDKLRESWNQVYQGTRNSHKVAVLEEGLKYHEIGIPPEQAQFLQTRKYQLNEILECVYRYLYDKNIADGKIYPEIIPQDTELPAIAYTQTNCNRDSALQKDTGFARINMQFNCYGDIFAAARALGKEIISALRDYKGDMKGADIQAVFIRNEYITTGIEPLQAWEYTPYEISLIAGNKAEIEKADIKKAINKVEVQRTGFEPIKEYLFA
jgi:HK97 family phage portal protein